MITTVRIQYYYYKPGHIYVFLVYFHVTTYSVMYACPCYIGNNCPSLSDPDNGSVHHLSNGTIAIFTCKSGFIKNGESVLHCINGKWSSSPPTCIQP